MARPDFAFATPTHVFRAAAEPGVYRAEPGGGTIHLTPERQHVPDALRSPHLERAVTAWVLARGGRTLNLDGDPRPIGPADLDRPPAGPVQRLVTIAPSNAEIVGAMGATDLLVGAESSSDYPPVVLELPRLGPDLHVDVEALAALQPDLVLASLSVPGMERNVAALDALGVPMLVLAPTCLADIRADVLRVGRALSREPDAARVVAAMDERLAALRGAAGERPPVRVLLQWWPKPIFTPAAHCWSNEMIAAAGGVNVFADLPGQSAEVTAGQVAAADPEAIFLCWCGVPQAKLNPQRVLREPALAGVSAVRTGRVYPLDEALVGRPGPRVVEGTARMAEALHAVRAAG